MPDADSRQGGLFYPYAHTDHRNADPSPVSAETVIALRLSGTRSSLRLLE